MYGSRYNKIIFGVLLIAGELVVLGLRSKSKGWHDPSISERQCTLSHAIWNFSSFTSKTGSLFFARPYHVTPDRKSEGRSFCCYHLLLLKWRGCEVRNVAYRRVGE